MGNSITVAANPPRYGFVTDRCPHLSEVAAHVDIRRTQATQISSPKRQRSVRVCSGARSIRPIDRLLVSTPPTKVAEFFDIQGLNESYFVPFKPVVNTSQETPGSGNKRSSL